MIDTLKKVVCLLSIAILSPISAMDYSSPSKRQRTLPLGEVVSARGFDAPFDSPFSAFLEDDDDDLIDFLPAVFPPTEQDDDDIGEKPATEDDFLRDLLTQGQSALGLSGFLSSEEDEENQDPICPMPTIAPVEDTAPFLTLFTHLLESEEKTLPEMGTGSQSQSSSAEEEDTEEIEKKYTCGYSGCMHFCWTQSGLNKHIRTKHKKKLYPCNFPGCDEVFRASSTLQGHKRKKGHQYFKCNHSGCDKGFTKSSDLRSHEEKEKHKREPFKCDYPGCDMNYVKLGNLCRHKKKEHGDDTGEKPAIEDDENQDPIFPMTSIPHPPAEDTAALLTLLTDFLEPEKKGTQEKTADGEADGPYVGTGRPSHLDSSSAEEEDIEEIEKPYPCNYPGCDEAFRASSTLQGHKRKKGHLYYKCNFPGCDEGFTKSADLREHEKKKKHQLKPFKCDFSGCNKEYPYAVSLRSHKASKHEGKKFKCDYPDCDEVCGSRATLYRHKYIHKGKTYACDHPDCDLSYPTPGGLRRHKKTKHGSA